MNTALRPIVVALASALVTAAAVLAVTDSAVSDPAATADSRAQPLMVVVVDRTRGQWAGIPAAVAGWDALPEVRVQMRDHCDPSAYCVVVQLPSTYDRDWLGWWLPVSRRVSTIQLNSGDDRAADPHIQAWTSCHELGHALGLPHVHAGTPSCMVNEPNGAAPVTPTRRDARLLDRAVRRGGEPMSATAS